MLVTDSKPVTPRLFAHYGSVIRNNAITIHRAARYGFAIRNAAPQLL